MEDSKERMRKLRMEQAKRQLEKEAKFVSTEESREECRMILDYYLGEYYEGELFQEHFVRWFEKGKKIDRFEAQKWLKENKDRFDPNMIKYAQTFFDEEI